MLILIGLIFSLSSCGGNYLFQSNPRKSPNVYSPKGPRSKSKTKRYGHSVSKKKVKRKNAVFSNKKKRFGAVVSGYKGEKDVGEKSPSGGRQSGKGRKK